MDQPGTIFCLVPTNKYATESLDGLEKAAKEKFTRLSICIMATTMPAKSSL
jgi:hypothetical protein